MKVFLIFSAWNYQKSKPLKIEQDLNFDILKSTEHTYRKWTSFTMNIEILDSVIV